MTQKPLQPGGLSLQGSHILSQLFCVSGVGASLQAFPAASTSTTPVEAVAIHQQKDRSQQTDRLTAPRLVRAVPAVVHPIAPLVSINPGSGAAAVENQVPWEAVGQVTCKGTHTGHAKPPQAHRHRLKWGWQAPKAAARTLPLQHQMNMSKWGSSVVGHRKSAPGFCFI